MVLSQPSPRAEAKWDYKMKAMSTKFVLIFNIDELFLHWPGLVFTMTPILAVMKLYITFGNVKFLRLFSL